jgi:WD40 repeat protein
MAAIRSCPNAERLPQLLSGRFPESEAHDLEGHLLTCPSCLERLKGLLAEDVLARPLRAGKLDASCDDTPLTDGLIARLKGLALLASGETMTTTDSVAGAPADGPETEALHDFLAPPQGPGEIGRLGGYRVLRVLGAGGMGVVFLAEDTRLQRRVALKAMLPALAASAGARQRFLREARLTASIAHDHIVTIHQVGEQRGVPFLAMQLLEGEALDDRLKREKVLPLPEVLRIGREVAAGLAAAHARGLIHRDIKPANNWLESLPNEPGGLSSRYRVKILDFGLARAAGDDAHLTRSGAIVGTPAYMAPEQALGQPVDARCDLFSLGGVLYRMCTGQPAFQGANAMATLLAVTQDHPTPPRRLNPEVPPALNNLILRLLAKQLPDRPASARAVVQAITAIEHAPAESIHTAAIQVALPVSALSESSAGPGPAAPPARRGRRRLLAVAAAGLLAAAALGAIIVLQLPGGQGKLEIESLDPDVEVSVRQNGREVAILDKKTQQEVTLPVGAYEVELKGKPGLTLETQWYTIKRGKTEIVRVMQVPTSGGPEPPLSSILAGEPLSQRGLVSNPAKIEGVQSWTIATVGHNGGADRVAYSPDDRIVATCGLDADGTVHLWDPNNGRLLRVLVGHQGYVSDASWSPDGKWLATGSFDGTVKVWQTESGRLMRTISALGEVRAVAWSPTRDILAIGSSDKTMHLVKALSGEMLAVWPGHAGPVDAVAWSPDGKSLASVGREDGLRVWSAQGESSRTLFQECQGSAFAVAWSPDEKTLAGNDDVGRCIRIWDTNSGKVLHTLHGEEQVRDLAWSPDGKRLVSCKASRGLQVWDAGSGKNLHTEKLNVLDTLFAEWSHDGKNLALCDSGSGRAQILDAESLHVGRTLHSGYLPMPLQYQAMNSWSPDGQTLAFTNTDHTVQLWDLQSRLPSLTLWHEKFLHGIGYLVWSPDAKTLCSGTTSSEAVLFDARSGVALGTVGNPEHPGARFTWWSPDSKALASAAVTDKMLRVWDPKTCQVVLTLDGNAGDFNCVAWSPGGKVLASGSGTEDGKVQLWDATSGKRLKTLEGATGGLRTLAWSPDSKMLAGSGEGTQVRIWDADSGKLVRTLPTLVRDMNSGFLAWSADGTTLDTIELSDSRIRTWDVATGQLRDTVTKVCSGALSPGRKTAAAHKTSVTVELMDADTGRRRALLVPLGNGRGLAISPEGHYRGTPGVERELVYVVQTDKGQETLTPQEFEQKYHWKNDPDRVRLAP